MPKLKNLVVLGLVICLTACSLYPAKFSPPPKYSGSINIPEQWKISGKIAIQSLQQGWQANFIWHKDKNGQWLRFSGPLGQEFFLIKQYWHDQRIINELWQQGQLFQASSMELLLEQQTGMNLPVKSLAYWIFGRYNPHFPVTLFDQNETQLLTHFEQQDWQIKFSYHKHFLPYPKKIVAQQNWIKLKVVITAYDNVLENIE